MLPWKARGCGHPALCAGREVCALETKLEGMDALLIPWEGWGKLAGSALGRCPPARVREESLGLCLRGRGAR